MEKNINKFGEWNDAINKLSSINKSKNEDKILIHREGLINIYESQLDDAGEFMSIVLKEAIRKLKETDINPKKIENWVVNLENCWMNI